MSEQIFVPHSRRIDLVEGSIITITGNTIKPLPDSSDWKFCISLCSEPYFGDNIPFHFSAEFSYDKKVILKSMKSGSWSKDDQLGKPFPFGAIGEPFTVIITLSRNFFKMNVNETEMPEYDARKTGRDARFLYIHGGAVTLKSIDVNPSTA